MAIVRYLATALACGMCWTTLAASESKYTIAAQIEPALEGAGGRYRVHGAQLRGAGAQGLEDARGRRLDGRLAAKEVLACGPAGDSVFANGFEN